MGTEQPSSGKSSARSDYWNHPPVPAYWINFPRYLLPILSPMERPSLYAHQFKEESKEISSVNQTIEKLTK